MDDYSDKVNNSIEDLPYYNWSYNTKERFCSYWHQIDEVLSLKPEKVLEIGIGNKFVTRYLIEKSIKVNTLDIVYGLKPDIAGSVLEIPFANESFDVVSCCEVLERLPYGDFAKALKEMWRVSRKHVVLSLPDATTVYRLNIELPRLKPIKKLIPHPFPRSTCHKFDGEHFWEIGKTDYELNKIILDIRRSRFKILKTYRVFELYYHRFFVLEK